MAHLVPEGCTKVVYDEWVYLFQISPELTAEMLVNFINESLIPEIEAISDNGAYLMKENTGNEALKLGANSTPYVVLIHSVTRPRMTKSTRIGLHTASSSAMRGNCMKVVCCWMSGMCMTACFMARLRR